MKRAAWVTAVPVNTCNEYLATLCLTQSCPVRAGRCLAIYRQIVQVWDGMISLENRLDDGKGSGLHATVRLPLVQNKATGGS